MKKFFIIFVLILPIPILGQFDSKNIAGAYQFCPFHCETIKLNEDFTFDYLLDGDLFNNQRTKGIWKFISENKIHLKSPEGKLNLKVNEHKISGRDKISVQVLDQNGAVFSGLTIKFKFLGKERKCVTDETGFCEIPKVEKFEVKWMFSSGEYRIKNSETNDLEIIIAPTSEPFIDDLFLIKDKELYRILDGKEVSEFGFKKLSDKITKKLFPAGKENE